MKPVGVVRICVTEEDIKLGRRSSRILCPVARAISRAVGEPVWAWYGVAQAADWYASLDPVASAFMGRFDMGRKVKPFEFELVEDSAK